MPDQQDSRYLLRSKNPWANKAGYDAAVAKAQDYQCVIDFTDALLQNTLRQLATPAR